LHELENSELVTWVFDDGFVPSAKLTSDGNYSIVSDYLGTPVEAYDADGKRVWSAELDIYGRVKEFSGAVGFVPFRYQGQYHDVETGLYYNRFRYYDPESGQYTQQDPISLIGGNPTMYGYVNNPNYLIDPFGLFNLNDTGFSVYGLFRQGSNSPYYIGITNNIDVRRMQHLSSGRLFGTNTLRELDVNLTYGQARGFEQARIEFHGTKTGIRGQAISSNNLGNKNNSFDIKRTDARGQSFNSSRTEKLSQLDDSVNNTGNHANNGGC
jgi:RHS repeat-associated protein